MWWTSGSGVFTRAFRVPLIAIPAAGLMLVASLLGLAGCTEATGPLGLPEPVLESVAPDSVRRGQDTLVLTATGAGFRPESMILWDGAALATTLDPDSRLTARVPAGLRVEDGARAVAVFTPSPGGGTSAPGTVTVWTPGVPGITSISPDSVPVGSSDVIVTAHGRQFATDSEVRWYGLPLPTTYHSSSLLEAVLPSDSLVAGRVADVTVFTPTPGGGTSPPAPLTVWNANSPSLDSIAPDAASWDTTDLEIATFGANFRPESSIEWNGAELPTTFVSGSELRAPVPDSFLRHEIGPALVRVRTPTGAGGTSAPATFTVLDRPVIQLLPSQGATAGGGGFDLLVHGHHFAEGASVRWNGAVRAAETLDSRRLRIAVPPGDVVDPATVMLSVINPDGSESDAVAFEVRMLGSATTSVTRLPMAGRDLAWDSATGRIYVSLPDSDAIAAVDPTAVGMVQTVEVGSRPENLAGTGDGRYLYVGLVGDSTARRVELATFTASLQWPLRMGHVPGDLAVVPGRPEVVVIANPHGSVVAYDNGERLPFVDPYSFAAPRIEFLDSPRSLYGYNPTWDALISMIVHASGVQRVGGAIGLITGETTDIVGTAGRVYSTNGAMVDAERFELVGSLPVNGRAMTVDAPTGRAYFLTDSGIEAYDLNTYQRLGSLSVGAVSWGSAAVGDRLIRWGTDGLAFLDDDELILVRSPLVAP